MAHPVSFKKYVVLIVDIEEHSNELHYIILYEEKPFVEHFNDINADLFILM